MGGLRPENLPNLFIIFLLLIFPAFYSSISSAQRFKTSPYYFGPFNASSYDTFNVREPATISNNALQLTPDSASANFSLAHRSGRVFFRQPFKLWDGDVGSPSERIASFNSTFDINIFRFSTNTTLPAGEGMAFIIAPDQNQLPRSSDGQYLGLTNSTIDNNSSNHLIAIELDTFKQDFDPDDNHMGLDINSIISNKTVSLTEFGIEIAPLVPKNYTVWVQYDGESKFLEVFMAQQGQPKPSKPVMDASLNIRDYVKQYSYMGFAASTGETIQLNCVLGWNLTVEIIPEKEHEHKWVKILLGVGIPTAFLLLISAVGFVYYFYKRRAVDDPNILGTLKSLPGTPREFRFKDLKKATNNFDEKMKLGQGGFGVVYRGVLPKENIEVAVKKFSRENIKGKDDFLAELIIINRLRHKHLVRLVGWCHKNGMLLLVYDYMPNGSLDNHIFGETQTTLNWDRRYKIINGVASALHYLHNEYDQKVVHRDLKASNIMLDSNYNARLGDFGLARALENEKTSYAELEGVPGTIGYIAPECFHTGRATRESDVYGFGAVVLEVVCGLRPWTKIAGFQFLVDWVWSLHREGRILEAVDEKLGMDYVPEQAHRLLLLGLACSHPIASERPKTQVISQIISGSVSPPNVPPFKPAFVWPSMGPMMTEESGTGTGTGTGTMSVMTMGTNDTTSSSYYHGSDSGWTPQFMSRESYDVGGYSNVSLV